MTMDSDAHEQAASARTDAEKQALSRRKAKPQGAAAAVAEEASAIVEVLSAESLANSGGLDSTDAVMLSNEFSRFISGNEAEGNRHYQQSLDLFGTGLAIIEPAVTLALKKSSGTIRSKSPITLLQRKLFNALLFIARPNLSTQKTFRAPVDYLSWVVNHDRVDPAYLKDSLREMKKVVIDIEDGADLGFISLIGTVVFKGKDVYFELPDPIRNIFSAPKKYYYISMAVNARFRSKYALALYEILKENEFRGQTEIMSVEQYREKMGIEDGEYLEFKRLSARAIAAPLLEIEELSDFTADIQYKTRGRKVIGIQFVNIRPNDGNRLEGDDGDRIQPEYWTMMRDDFGLSKTQIESVTTKYKRALVEEVCDVLYYRYVCKNRAIKNGNRLLVTGLDDSEGKYHLTTKERNELVVAKERNRKKSLHEQMEDAQRREYALRKRRLFTIWANWTAEEQNQKWSEFGAAEECKGIIATRHYSADTPSLEHPAVSAAFMNYALRMGWLDL